MKDFDRLIATKDTCLVVRPLQSSVLMAEALPNQVYLISEGTALECARLDWHEGAHFSDDLDGDDYWHPMLREPLKGSPVLNWYAFAQHFKAIERSHPELTDAPVVVSEDKKKDVASLIKAASTKAMADDSAAKEEDLGPLIQLPGRDFQRPRHIYEPIFWKDGKPAPFTWAEMTANGSRIPENERICYNIIKIVKVLSYFREVLAQPIEVTSGYRDPTSNRRVGGARFSRHLEGDAVDWKPMQDGITKAIWVEICRLYLGGGLSISGYDGEPEYGFFHTDGRGGGDPLSDYSGRTFWDYPNVPSWVRSRNYSDYS